MAPSSSRARNLVMKIAERSSLKILPSPNTTYQYGKSHCGDKTILLLSYLHNGISYTGKTTSLYWIRPQVPHTCVTVLTGDPLHSRALAHSRAPLFTQPCTHCSHSRAPGEQWVRLCVFTLQGCVQAAWLCRGSPVVLGHHWFSKWLVTCLYMFLLENFAPKELTPCHSLVFPSWSIKVTFLSPGVATCNTETAQVCKVIQCRTVITWLFFFQIQILYCINSYTLRS